MHSPAKQIRTRRTQSKLNKLHRVHHSTFLKPRHLTRNKPQLHTSSTYSISTSVPPLFIPLSTYSYPIALSNAKKFTPIHSGFKMTKILRNELVDKLIPHRFTSSVLDFQHEIPLTMPKAAWNASLHQLKRSYAVELVIELLSDVDTASTSENVAKVKGLLDTSPDLNTEPFDMIKLQRENYKLEDIRNKVIGILDTRLQYDDLTILRKEAHQEFEQAEKGNQQDDAAEWQSVMAQTDETLFEIKKNFPEMEERLLQAVLPYDEDDARNAVLEIRPGTGGDEAALFAAQMFHMYEKFCNNNSMRFQIDHIQAFDAVGSQGYKEAIATIAGDNVFGFLKHEMGVHRVQRIPDTESQGRVHTSTVTVAVMPEATEVDVEIRECDLRIDTYRSSGAGGQHVNTTDSAVRITHIPTGVVVTNQDERSQHKNKDKAMKYLRTRILDIRRTALAEERALLKGSQIGTGDRNERIRTYNFSQDRVTDHRVNVTLSNINAFMIGEEGLLKVQEQLSLKERLELLLDQQSAGQIDPNAPPTKGKGKKK